MRFAPLIRVELTICDAAKQAIVWRGSYEPPAQSVDQRLKYPIWMELFEKLGGDLQLRNVEIRDVEYDAKTADLVVIAGGQGEIASIFDRDPEYSLACGPMRTTTMLYVSGIEARSDSSQGRLVILPGIGEIVWFPAITVGGPCYIVGFGAVIGGSMDCFRDTDDSATRINLAKRVLQKHVPRLTETWNRIELTDPNGTLTGTIVPTIRKPVGRLPSGKIVLGIGDTVILNDPIAAQGSNNASKAAQHYERSILTRSDGAFDEDWMHETFTNYWQDAYYSVALSNLFLRPMSSHVRALFAAAQHSEVIRRTIMMGFNRPRTLFPWLTDAAATKKLIHEHGLIT
jgi:hypothetical protein